MSTIVTRSGKGSPLTNTEVDANFTNLNTDKLELSGGSLTGNLSLGDNVKLQLGNQTNGDLQIYHDGSHSRLVDNGTGNFIIQAGQFRVNTANDSEAMIKADVDGAVSLYNSGDLKLATNSSGISVTGSVVADGLTVDGTINAYRSGYTQGIQLLGDSGGNQVIGTATNDKSLIIKNLAATKGIEFVTTNKSLDIANNGDISFYNDSAAQALFWDSSTSRLGLGTTVPSRQLSIYGTNDGYMSFNGGRAGNHEFVVGTDSSGFIIYDETLSAYRLVIDQDSGNVGIGVSSPSAPLHINAAGKGDIYSGLIQNSTTDTDHYNVVRFMQGASGSATGYIGTGGSATSNPAFRNSFVVGTQTSSPLVFATNDTERARIDSSGAATFSGSVTSTGLTVDGDVAIASDLPSITLTDNNNSSSRADIKYNFGYLSIDADANSVDPAEAIDLKIGGATYFRLATGGDISFYEDTGTTPKLFWDASAEQLQLGGIEGNAGGALVAKTDSDGYALAIEENSGNERWSLGVNAAGDLGFLNSSDTTASVTFDDSGNVGIGTSSPVGLLNLEASSGNSQLYITTNDTTSRSQLIFGDSADANVGGVQYNHSDDSMQFHSGNGGERMRIDSSGNLLVGKTASNSGTVGVEARATGRLFATADGAYAAKFERLSSDGTLIQLTKDGATVGSIGTKDSLPYFAGTSIGLRISGTQIRPSTSSGANNDNAVDLGKSDTRFKDLYLSNKVYANYIGSSGDTNTNIYFPTADQIRFITGGQEAARIDASQNLLVGKTSNSYNTAGAVLGSTGSSNFTRDGNPPVGMNRLSSDGSILNFAKDGTTVGSIGTRLNRMYIGTGDTGVLFDSTNDAITPENTSTPASRDAAIDLGRSTTRFKDLYLSGGVSTNTTTGLSITANSSNRGILNLSTSQAYQLIGGTHYGYTGYKTGGYHRWFGSDGTDNMRLSGGNLLVGRTSTTTSNLGVTIPSSGAIQATANFNALGLNRLSGDGDIAIFQKSGATVGSIGVASNDLNINGGANHSGIRFQATGLYPLHNGTASSAEVDLGATGSKFRNLFLAGGVYLGGTGSANKLDDYEEGTWTPSLVGSTTAGTATFVSGPTGTYTKIGNQVTVYFNWGISAHTGAGALRVNGLPFTQTGVAVGAIMSGNYAFPAGRPSLVAYGTGAVMRFYGTGSGVGYVENVLDVSHQMNGSLTYTV